MDLSRDLDRAWTPQCGEDVLPTLTASNGRLYVLSRCERADLPGRRLVDRYLLPVERLRAQGFSADGELLALPQSQLVAAIGNSMAVPVLAAVLVSVLSSLTFADVIPAAVSDAAQPRCVSCGSHSTAVCRGTPRWVEVAPGRHVCWKCRQRSLPNAHGPTALRGKERAVLKRPASSR